MDNTVRFTSFKISASCQWRRRENVLVGMGGGGEGEGETDGESGMETCILPYVN